MKKLFGKLAVSFALAACLVAGLTACNTPKLATGGAYAPTNSVGQADFQPDVAFYAVDSAFLLAYNTLDLAFNIERDNRAIFKQISPEIKKTLDAIRPEAVKMRDEYATARKVYKANPTSAGLDTMESVLAKVRQLSLTAQAVLPSTKGN